MREPHIGEKFRALVELVVAAWVFVWILALPVPRVFSTRLYFTLAVSIAAGFLIFCWDVFIASVARKQDWMRKTCYLLGGAVVIVPAVIWSLFHDPLFSTRGYVLFGVASISGFICRKLAYPQLTEEQATAPEPPITFFPEQNSVLTNPQLQTPVLSTIASNGICCDNRRATRVQAARRRALHGPRKGSSNRYNPRSKHEPSD